MNANGVLASMNFPTMAGFNARTFTEVGRQGARRSSCCRPTTTGPIDEWCGAYPGRFIPLGIVPMWDVDLAAEEVHRRRRPRAVGRSASSRRPHVQGFPSFLSGYWDPMLRHLGRATWCCRCTSAAGSR